MHRERTQLPLHAREPPLHAALSRHARLRARTGHTLPPARTQLSPALPREAGTCVLNTSAGSSRMTSTSYLFFCHLTFTGIVPAMVPMRGKSVQRMQTSWQENSIFVFAGNLEEGDERRKSAPSALNHGEDLSAPCSRRPNARQVTAAGRTFSDFCARARCLHSSPISLPFRPISPFQLLHSEVDRTNLARARQAASQGAKCACACGRER